MIYTKSMVALIEAMLDSPEYQVAHAARSKPSAHIAKGSAEAKLIDTLKANIKGLVGQPHSKIDPDKLNLGNITEDMVEQAVERNRLRDKLYWARIITPWVLNRSFSRTFTVQKFPFLMMALTD